MGTRDTAEWSDNGLNDPTLALNYDRDSEVTYERRTALCEALSDLSDCR